ncbi:MAG: DNA repair protein RadA [Spirochaetota bacterium]
MAKKKSSFVCISCGQEFSKWSGRCLNCGEWNSIVEAERHIPQKLSSAEAVRLDRIESDNLERISSGIGEFDLACGGGIVRGAVTLIGGEPGIGKSTLSLQIAGSMNTLYVSGEESATQIRQRADRLHVNQTNIHITSATVVENIIELIEKLRPQCVFVDSIQTVSSSEISGPPGSISQLRESALRLTSVAKSKNIPLFLIGHITKEGSIAGPKILEHVVDTVLYFEGDFNKEYRILRSFKNRFGSVNEIGLFSMSDRGLIEVNDKNSVFLNPGGTDSPGTAVGAAIEGSRTILFEVQSLVVQSSFSNPRRTADGLDFNRLVILVAAMERYAGLKLSGYDVFINVAGGFSINETSSDLAVAISIASGYHTVSLSKQDGFVGEISLSGDIRPVSQIERRVTEYRRSNFRNLFVPSYNVKEAKKSAGEMNVTGVRTIREAISTVFTRTV